MNVKMLRELSVLSSFLIIVLQFFQWKLVEVLTVFLMPVVWLVVYGFFLVIFIASIIRLVKKKDWKPVAIQTMTIVLLFLIPFNQIIINLDFKMNKSERTEVIAKVQDETFNPNVAHNASLIQLPDEYKHISKGGGEIIIEKQDNQYSVLFFTFRGVLDNFSGFVYSPNDEKPALHAFGGDYKERIKMDDHWYFVSSY